MAESIATTEPRRSRGVWRRSRLWLGVAVLGGTLVGWSFWRESGDSVPNLSATKPAWVLRLTAGAPTRYEALFRVGNGVRVLTGVTPAEWRVEKAALVAQFRSLPAGLTLELAVRDPDGASWTSKYPRVSREKALTHYCTRGRYWIPRIGESGTTEEVWGARERIRKPWTPSLSWRAPTEDEVRSIPSAEPWPSSDVAAAGGG